ncbi:MAG: peptidoglycan DD-metalloendopeptidase family protein [Gammaproteobacteria bacterium]|nr:peptidoglycan DD-metalloendopeptidase family protein [Gammaproteobacteria bacterium]
MNYDRFINKDFRNHSQNNNHPRLRWLLLIAGCALISVVLAASQIDSAPDALPDTTEALTQLNDTTDAESRLIKLQLPSITSATPDNEAEASEFSQQHQWQSFTIKSGDSLSSLFDKAGIKPDQLIEVIKLGDDSRALKRIHPGDKIQLETNEQGQLLALNYNLDYSRYLRIIRQADGLSAKTMKHAIETRTAYAHGEIDSSLFLASQRAGLSQNLTMELANIFGWDIDFALDIREGDRFNLIYEEIFKDGEKIRDGNILAAEFINQGRTYRALRYTNPTTNEAGYYSPDGLSLRKAFLRSPVNFSRISSKFTTRRFHPLLHKFRSHKGVDYAAARGTPVRASGNGKVVFKGVKGGYGKTLILKHGGKYSTLYAHLSNYNRNLRSGSKVSQGQVIGYVGSTGLASGPHLHYEFRVNGAHRNPLTVKFPSTSPIPQRHKDNFELTTQTYIAQLDVLSRNTLAFNDEQ